MLLYITHTTTYHYVPQVNTAQHMAHLLPRSDAAQTVQHTELHITPTPAATSTHVDVFGNNRTFFSLPVVHDTLSITAKSTVDTHFIHYPPEQALTTPAWENVRAHFVYHSGAAWDAATEYVFASPYVQPHPDFAEYARTSFTPARPVLPAACDLMTRIHQEFTYETASTDINTPALEALKSRKGVCQDFAHILIGCLRTQGLAARYVSGYLVTEVPEGQTRLIGSDASHAWVSVYVPNDLDDAAETAKTGALATHGQWFDLDPTNNRWGLSSPGIDYVTLAIGRDYADVSPVRGVIHGGASHTLEVAVTVQPASELIATSGQTQSQTQGQSQTQPQSQSQSQSQSHSQS
jgi:transglutaminase-like putative cysteine protease